MLLLLQELGDTLPACLVLLRIFHIPELGFLPTTSNKDQHSSNEASILDSTVIPFEDQHPENLYSNLPELE